jgi:hypothetical protein
MDADGNNHGMAGETGFVPFPSHFAPACGALMLRSSGHRVFPCLLGAIRVVERRDVSLLSRLPVTRLGIDDHMHVI